MIRNGRSFLFSALAALAGKVRLEIPQLGSSKREEPKKAKRAAPELRTARGYLPHVTGWQSHKRRRRKALMKLHGITSGRQWVKLRKRLQREEKAHAHA